MTFPSVRSSTSNSGGTSTSISATMPATVNAGDRLVIVMAQGSTSGTALTYTLPSGWVQRKVFNNSGSAVGGVIFEKMPADVDGTEGGTTVTITASASPGAGTSIATYAIQDSHPTAALEVSSGSTSSSTTTPDPDTKTPTWGAAENLWIAAFGKRASSALNSYPTNYTQDQQSANASNIRCAIATRISNSSSENPGSFSLATAVATWACTIAIRPAPITNSLPLVQSARHTLPMSHVAR